MAKKIKLWVLTPEQAEKFYEQALMKEAVTEKERIEILDNMELPNAEFQGEPEEFVKEISKKAKVLIVKGRKNNGKSGGSSI